MWVNVPFSFWVIDETNNTFEFMFREQYGTANDLGDVKSSSFRVWKTLTLAPGTYTPIAFQQEFRRAIAAGDFFDSVQAPALLQKINCIFMSTDGRVIFNNGNAGENHFTIRFGNNVELAEMLGFRPNIEYWSGYGTVWKDGAPVDGGNNTYIASERTVKLIGVPRLNLHGSLSGEVDIGGGMTRVNKNSGSDILVSFPINGAFGSYLYNQLPSQPIVALSESIDTVSFYLTHGDRKKYSKRRTLDYASLPGVNASYDMSLYAPSDVVNYLPLNGEGFQVCVRFFIKQ